MRENRPSSALIHRLILSRVASGPPKGIHAPELYMKRVPRCDPNVTLPSKVHTSCTCSRVETLRNASCARQRRPRQAARYPPGPAKLGITPQTMCRRRSHSSKIPELFRSGGVTMAVSAASSPALKHSCRKELSPTLFVE